MNPSNGYSAAVADTRSGDLGATLQARGYCSAGPLLSGDECEELVRSYEDEARFRSRIVMARHNFGLGEYKYFARPLPEVVERLRHGWYARLAPVANAWNELSGRAPDYPATLAEFTERCRAAGQTRPTPLILRYETGGYNCLHQDLYGEVFFPFQVVVLLSEPEDDFAGGEFVLVEQRPRAQSRATVVPLHRGEGVVFTTGPRPVAGSRGHFRVTTKHGISELRSGTRLALGIIFHDAQ